MEANAPKRARVGAAMRAVTANLDLRGVPRLLYSTRRFVLGGPGVFETEGGISMMLDPEDYFQCMMYYRRYSQEILRTIEQVVRPGDTVIDAGAHIGYFSLQLASIVGPTGRVYSFEPDPRAMAFLRTSQSANRFEWLTPVPAALASSRARGPFFLSPQLGWSTAVSGSHLQHLQPVEVDMMPLDALVEQGEVGEKIDFIKMDVEGFELEVLKGMRGVLARSRPALLTEVNSSMLSAQGTTPDEMLRLLVSAEYEIYGVRPENHLPVRLDDGAALTDSDILCIPTERSGEARFAGIVSHQSRARR